MIACQSVNAVKNPSIVNLGIQCSGRPNSSRSMIANVRMILPSFLLTPSNLVNA
jgi:hypothetical protein